MTKRLTHKQKEDILESFKLGTPIDVLSDIYNCTNSTIIRNLKKDLGELKFKELLIKSKSLKGKPKTSKNKINDLRKTNSDHEDSKLDSKNSRVLNENKISSNFDPID